MSQRTVLSPLLSLDARQRHQLTQWTQTHSMRARLRERARIVLAAADSGSYRAIAAELQISRQRVALWCERFRAGGIETLTKELPRLRAPAADAAKVAEIVRLTTHSTPNDATQWSEHRMAAHVGVSESTVLRIWRTFGLDPNDAESFELGNDAQFVDRLEGIVGLYLSPPGHTLVLCCNGNDQAPAMASTQPGAPSNMDGRAFEVEEDRRQDIPALLAALHALDHNVIEDRRTMHRRHVEWLGLLRLINRQTPQDKQLHLICDNRATYSHANVRVWLKKHPRFHVHFTPTTASWLSTIDCFFLSLTRVDLRRGVLRGVDDLAAAIPDYIAANRGLPKPFVWAARTDATVA